MADHRTLITHLCDELDHCRRMLLDDRQVTHPLADRARAALVADGPAVPEGREPASVTGEPSDEKGPSAEEVEELCEEHSFNVEGYESIECLQGLINEAIARWGRPAPVPDGEVRELVAWLREQADHELGCTFDTDYTIEDAAARNLTRAADLLERQAAPVPVPVSERLPGVRDCAPWPGETDASAWCWVGSDVDGGWSWEQRSAGCLAAFPDDFTHWLPANAVPLPSVEVVTATATNPLHLETNDPIM